MTMVTLTNLTVASGRDYQIVPNLQLRQQAYTDRAYIVTAIPTELVGATYIQTANDDKKETGADFLAFEVDQPVTVYVGHDVRIATKPLWLRLFEPTGKDLMTSDARLHLYSQAYPAGRIAIGGNALTASGSMYVVCVQPTTIIPEPPVIPPLPDRKWDIIQDMPGVVTLENHYDPTDPDARVRFTVDMRRKK